MLCEAEEAKKAAEAAKWKAHRMALQVH